MRRRFSTAGLALKASWPLAASRTLVRRCKGTARLRACAVPGTRKNDYTRGLDRCGTGSHRTGLDRHRSNRNGTRDETRHDTPGYPVWGTPSNSETHENPRTLIAMASNVLPTATTNDARRRTTADARPDRRPLLSTSFHERGVAIWRLSVGSRITYLEKPPSAE